MALLKLFISMARLLARLSEELHCCRLTAQCLVLPVRTHNVSVYLKRSRLRFHKDPESAWTFHRDAQKFTRHETAADSRKCRNSHLVRRAVANASVGLREM